MNLKFLIIDNVFLNLIVAVYLFTAVIEHVRDGCTVRAFLLPSFDYVTVMLSGIKVSTCIMCEMVVQFEPSFCPHLLSGIKVSTRIILEMVVQ